MCERGLVLRSSKLRDQLAATRPACLSVLSRPISMSTPGVGMLKTLIAGTASTQHDVERVLSKAVEFAPNGVALTAADGRILLTNAELQRMFGYGRTELLEQPIEQLLPERFRA